MTLRQLRRIDVTIKKQIDWDEKSCDIVLRRISKLKISINGIHTEVVSKYKNKIREKNELYAERYKYYIEEHGRKYGSDKAIEYIINTEQNFKNICKDIQVLEIAEDHLATLMKNLHETEFDIKNWIEFKKLQLTYGL